MHVDQQGNGYDRGLYAIAFATSLLAGENPTELRYDAAALRGHFGACINAGAISPFVSTLEYRHPKVNHEIEVDVYCICRCPDDGKLMVECEGCQEWFHASCLKLSHLSVKNWKKCASCQY